MKTTIGLLLTVLACGSAWAETAEEPVGTRDRLQISAANLDEYRDIQLDVGEDGALRLPLIGAVGADGKTVAEIEDAIREKLRVYLIEPQVTVRLVERRSRPVYLLGAVANPGVRQLTIPMTLAALITEAGGLSPDAGATIVVRRRVDGASDVSTPATNSAGSTQVLEFNVRDVFDLGSENIVLQPYDSIFVQRAQMVYVVGEVGTQGRIPMNERNRLTVLDAISAAGGLKPLAAPGKAKILRPVPGEERREEMPVDVKQIFSGKAEDIALTPGDILYVPDSTSKKARSVAVTAAVQAATSILTWGFIY